MVQQYPNTESRLCSKVFGACGSAKVESDTAVRWGISTDRERCRSGASNLYNVTRGVGGVRRIGQREKTDGWTNLNSVFVCLPDTATNGHEQAERQTVECG
jgi:hypothetical protein